MSDIIKLTSRYTVFVIYNKSHYPSTYNVLRKKTVVCDQNIISAKLGEMILKKGLIYHFVITSLT